MLSAYNKCFLCFAVFSGLLDNNIVALVLLLSYRTRHSALLKLSFCAGSWTVYFRLQCANVRLQSLSDTLCQAAHVRKTASLFVTRHQGSIRQKQHGLVPESSRTPETGTHLQRALKAGRTRQGSHVCGAGGEASGAGDVVDNNRDADWKRDTQPRPGIWHIICRPCRELHRFKKDEASVCVSDACGMWLATWLSAAMLSRSYVAQHRLESK